MKISGRVKNTIGIASTIAVCAALLTNREDTRGDTKKSVWSAMAASVTREDKTKPTYSRFWGYQNPFGVNCNPSPWTAIKWKVAYTNQTDLPNSKDSKELDENLPIYEPNFDNPSSDGIRVTWLGHATTLVQLDGVTILTDPVFSNYCGINSTFSYKRFRDAPCTVDDLPSLDAVIISHSHFDHLDEQSVKDIQKKFGDRVNWFVPEGLKSWFTSSGCGNVQELNWWEEIELPLRPDVKMVLTPAQHWSGRNLVIDKNRSLWGSWCVIGPKHRFFFAGDTGYNEVAFKQIGHHYGPFDLAALPIGAYIPRNIMKPQHVDPEQAVMIHEDINAKKSVGIHWGTFALAYEYYMQPPEDLKKALEAKGLSEDDFFVLNHGESWPKEASKDAAAKL